MTTPSSRYRTDVLRYFYALTAVLVVSGIFLTFWLFAIQRGEQRQREHLAQFHLRIAMLTGEASGYLSEIQQAVQARSHANPGTPGGASSARSARRAQTATHALGQAVRSIVSVQREWREAVDPFWKTAERVDSQFTRLEEGTGIAQTVSAEEVSRRAAALQFSLMQLERLHSIAAKRLLEDVTREADRKPWSTALGIALVLVISGLIIARILFILRGRLRGQEVTEQALLERERQLRQSSKMEALGTLVGGVAHDFNNILTAILGNVEWLQEEMEPGHRHQENLAEIRKAGERATNMTRQLLAFSRQQPVSQRVIDVNMLIRDVETMLHRLIREDVTLTLQLDVVPCHANVDPVQLEQVMINLAVNARDAMKSGGELTVATSVEQLTARHPDFPALRSDEYIRITVQDTGCGMTPESLALAFDPFYTTKGPGKGTGLGLSTVHGIVSQSGGHIQAESEVGAGTRFEIYLPRSAGPVASQIPDAESPGLDGGSETVLVAEDEPQIRSLVATALRHAGYNVLEAGDGRRALEMCSEYAGPLHLILSDVVMPGLRGPEMVRRALESHPEARVIYISGYNQEDVLTHGALSESVLLPKPFKMRELLELVRKQLNAPRDQKDGSHDRHAASRVPQAAFRE